jgi:flagellar M-ring protein FliF
LADFLSSLQKTWQGLSAPQRVGTILAVLAGGGILAGISYFANRPEYRALAGGDPTKLGEIAAALESAGIQPKIIGNSVTVPVEQFDKAYLAIASLGLNTDGVGFELLDKGTNAFTTSLLEKVNVQRATAGELERILRGYPGISKARVLISQDRESWKTNEKDGTASVSVTLRPGVQLGATDVAAIQACVANSWHSLRPDNVAVIANGKKLTRETNEADKSFAAANHQLLTQGELEDGLRKRAQEALDRAQGPGKTHVTVSATLNFDTLVEKSEVLDPDRKSPRKVEQKDTNHTSGDGGTAGAVGVAANVPNENAERPATKSESSTEIDNSVTTEYVQSSTSKVHEKRGFEITRLSVALFVDKSLRDRLPELEKVVKAAVGFDEKRKDQFSGSAESDFAKLPDEQPAAEPVASSNLPELVATGGRVAVLLGLIVLFLFLLKKAGKAQPMTIYPQRAGAAGGGAVFHPNQAGGGANIPGALPEGAVIEKSPEETARNTVLKNATSAAVADPAAGGRVVRSWLEEKRGR